MPNFLDILKQGISETSSQIKNKGLGGWIGEKSAEVGQMFGNAAVDLAAKELDLNSEEIKQLKNLRDNADAIKQLKDQLGDVNLQDVDPEVVKRNLEYLSKTDLSKTGLGTETAKEVIPEPIKEQITETVKQETPKSVQAVTQPAQTTIPEVAKKYNFFDLNKNGHISDDLIKIGLGVGAAAALGYGAHKLYKHFKNKKKDMSEKDHEEFDKYYMQKSINLRDEIASKISQKYADDIFDNYLLNRYPTYDESLSKEQNYKNMDNRFKIYRRDALNKKFFTDKNDMSEWWIGPAAAATALGSLALINHLKNRNEEDEFARDFYGPKEFRRRKKSEKVFNKFSPKIDDVYSKAGASKLSNGVYMLDVPGYPKLKEYHKYVPTEVRKDSSKPFKYDFIYESIVEPSPEEKEKDNAKLEKLYDKQYNRKDLYKYNSDYLDTIVDDQFMKYKAKKYGMPYKDMINLQNTVVDMSEQQKKKMSLGKKVALGILGAGALGAGAYGMYKLGQGQGFKQGYGEGWDNITDFFTRRIRDAKSLDAIKPLANISPDEVAAERFLNGDAALKYLEGKY